MNRILHSGITSNLHIIISVLPQWITMPNILGSEIDHSFPASPAFDKRRQTDHPFTLFFI